MRKRSAETQAEILALLKRRAGPLTAYEILARLGGEGARIAPPTIYRALAALIDRGRAHRIESINAFVACQREEHGQGALLSICDDCGGVEEHVDRGIVRDLSALAGRSGFRPSRHVIEVHGLCGGCSGATR